MDPLVPWFIADVLLAAVAVVLAYRLRDIANGDGPGGDDTEVVLPPDPGGLAVFSAYMRSGIVDWDAELQTLLSTLKGTVK